MNKEQLRMQMIAGIITEGQYKKQINEIGSMERVEVKNIDNRDRSTTDLILDNNTIVEVDVVDLFENMLNNQGDDELLDMFENLINRLNNLD